GAPRRDRGGAARRRGHRQVLPPPQGSRGAGGGEREVRADRGRRGLQLQHPRHRAGRDPYGRPRLSSFPRRERNPGAPVFFAVPVHICSARGSSQGAVPAGGLTVDTNLTPPVQQALMQRWEPLYRSQLHYLVSWSTRGRRPVLKERHIDAIHELIRATCEERDFGLVEVVAGHDTVHVLFGLKPTQSVASAVRELKGRTTMTLLQRFP